MPNPVYVGFRKARITNLGRGRPAAAKRNFVPARRLSVFGLCRGETAVAKRRNARADVISRYNAARGDDRCGDDIAERGRFSRPWFCALRSALAKPRPSPRWRPSRAAGPLTDAADCGSCHTADPAKPFAGGKRIDTPFGGIYSANLTPDRDTGLGAWSDDDFVRALRYGVAPDGSRYYPAFPYPHFTKLIRPDVLAIRAYLETLPPVRNTPPPPQLRWPLNYRVVMRAWNVAFFRPGIFEPDQNKSAEWNRGGYLVEGAGALRRMPHAEEFLRRREARPEVWRRPGRTAGLRRGSMAPPQRTEILERRRHR